MTDDFTRTSYDDFLDKNKKNVYYHDANQTLRVTEEYVGDQLRDRYQFNEEGNIHGLQRRVTPKFGVENFYMWRGAHVTPQYFNRLQNEGWTLNKDSKDRYDFHDAQGNLRRSDIFGKWPWDKDAWRKEAEFEYDENEISHGEQVNYCWDETPIIQKTYQWHGRPVPKILFNLAETAADIFGVKPVDDIIQAANRVFAQLQPKNPISPQ